MGEFSLGQPKDGRSCFKKVQSLLSLLFKLLNTVCITLFDSDHQILVATVRAQNNRQQGVGPDDPPNIFSPDKPLFWLVKIL